MDPTSEPTDAGRSSGAVPEQGRSAGLLPGLVLLVAVAIALVTVVVTYRATTFMEEELSQALSTSGRAIALSLAAAVADPGTSDLPALRSLVDAASGIEGVAYVYLEDARGEVRVHTFSPTFPPELRGVNRAAGGAMPLAREVRTATLELSLQQGDGSRRALSVVELATPVPGNDRGVVHVGMDRGSIDSRVARLRARMAWSGAVATLACLAAVLFILLFGVVRPLRELIRASTDIAVTRDLTRTVAFSSGGEIGRLAGSFTLMVEKLREFHLSLQDFTAPLAGAASNLDLVTGKQGELLSRQAKALEETQITVEEIKQTSLLAAEKAEVVLRVAERADAISVEGQVAIQRSLTAMKSLQELVEETSRQILQLSERTQQIGGITETVKDLADQSNMLALNAAIEAVRSGEHGKGFAVVAREIRHLADQSIRATEGVREILDDISVAIRSAVERTEKGAARMEAGMAQVRASGDVLMELSNIVKEDASAVRQIAAAVNQQNAGIGQIFAAVTELSKQMETSLSRVVTTGAAATALREVAGRVQQVVQSYKV